MELGAEMSAFALADKEKEDNAASKHCELKEDVGRLFYDGHFGRLPSENAAVEIDNLIALFG